jgi:protein-S-isoprenylcysteine O-methyltransferase Ste14
MATAAMKKKALLLFSAALAVIGLMFFVPAGTLDYWQAWAYIAMVFIPASLVILYFLNKDPEFLERRMKLKEKEAKQQLVVKLSGILFVIGFLIPGLDHRFGWSNVPFELVAAADACVLIGYLICFLVFRENSYAGRTIEVVKGQKVISTGPYSIIRHPMYFGVLLMYLATPIALGSYWALPPFLLVVPIILFRILNEEEVLRRELPGYADYCKKTRYRLIPYVW